MKTTQSRLILILILLVHSLNAQAQELIQENVYSQSVGDSVELKVWLPKNYDAGNSYPVIYEFVYDHTDYIAATLNHLYECPSAIVVHASFFPGTSYDEPTLSAEGKKYYQFVKEELLSYIELKYHTVHRTAMGLSQGADYVNYILRTNPELFDAYMIFAIESPEYQADFVEYTNKIQEKKDYFIAIADDVERRVQFANELHEQLIKSAQLNVVKKEYESAAHSYAILYGLVDGLLYTYRDFVVYRMKEEEESFSEYFSNVVKEIEGTFGTPMYNGLIIEAFEQLTAETPKTEIETVLKILYADEANITDLDLFNLGYILYEELGFLDLAVATFRQSIERGKNLPVTERMMVLNNTYAWLARVHYKQEAYDEIYASLDEGYEVTRAKYLLMRYALYSVNLGDNAQIEKGIKKLDKLLALPASENLFVNPEQPQEVIYTLYAKGYWKLGEKAKSREFLAKALEVDPTYESALEFQKSIQ
ncbi:MAG: alpha/beta hydrolase-fold protein [Bacteroidota bacterium]